MTSNPGLNAIYIQSDPIDLTGDADADADDDPKDPLADKQLMVDLSNRRKGNYRCPTCGKKFKYNSCLHKHIVYDCKQEYRCTLCNKSFANKYILNGHVMRHTGEQPFHCLKCSRKFTYKSDYQRHICAAAVNPVAYCTECARTFTDPEVHKQHMLIHTGQQPSNSHMCVTCDKVFTRQSSLTHHRRKHAQDGDVGMAGV